MIKFPYYSGNIRNPNCLGYVSLDSFIEVHRNPLPNTLAILEEIQIARDNKDDELKAKLKQKLMAFTPSVMIRVGDPRKYKKIQEFTGLMQIDLDKIPSLNEAIGLKEHIFHSYEEIVCAYLSPSGRGVKALMRIKKPSMIGGVYTREYAIDKYKSMHRAVQEEFKQYEYFDSATKNSILPLFQSHDADILHRNFDETKIWSKEKWLNTEYENLNDTDRFKYDDSSNYNKSIDIVVNAINNITDNGHPQVRTASLILGSRVGAGYITRSEAIHLMENLIKSNHYLQKDVRNYIKTSVWGIEQGMKNPKYY